MVHRLDDQRETGAVAVIVAVSALAFFVLVAFVMDLGLTRETRRQLQTAADLAALAAAGEMYDTAGNLQPAAALAAARTYGQANDPSGEGADPDIYWDRCTATLLPGWTQRIASLDSNTPCISFWPNASRPRKVRVVVQGSDSPGLFGGYAGPRRGVAEAQALDPGVMDCSLCVLGEIEVKKDGTVRVASGGSMFAGAEKVHDAGLVRVVDGGSIGFPTTVPPGPQFDPEPVVASPSDPFGGAIMPVTPTTYSTDDECSGGVLPTNVAYDDLDVDGSCSFTGVLVVTGKLKVDGTLTGTNGTVFLTCSRKIGGVTQPAPCGPGDKGGELQVKEDGLVEVTKFAPGFGVLYHPDNRADFEIDEDAELRVAGADVYKPVGECVDVKESGTLTVDDGRVSVTCLKVEEDALVTVVSASVIMLSGSPHLTLLK